jgi:predicted DNA-binding protein (UPF0251 family)
MTSNAAMALWKLIGALLVLTMPEDHRIRLNSRQGLSHQSTADHLGISRSQVREALAY